ncbi:MAG: Multidrug efflux pump P55, partial [uncultured Nocardioidaceae bacterium]
EGRSGPAPAARARRGRGRFRRRRHLRGGARPPGHDVERWSRHRRPAEGGTDRLRLPARVRGDAAPDRPDRRPAGPAAGPGRLPGRLLARLPGHRRRLRPAEHGRGAFPPGRGGRRAGSGHTGAGGGHVPALAARCAARGGRGGPGGRQRARPVVRRAGACRGRLAANLLGEPGGRARPRRRPASRTRPPRAGGQAPRAPRHARRRTGRARSGLPCAGDAAARVPHPRGDHRSRLPPSRRRLALAVPAGAGPARPGGGARRTHLARREPDPRPARVAADRDPGRRGRSGSARPRAERGDLGLRHCRPRGPGLLARRSLAARRLGSGLRGLLVAPPSCPEPVGPPRRLPERARVGSSPGQLLHRCGADCRAGRHPDLRAGHDLPAVSAARRSGAAATARRTACGSVGRRLPHPALSCRGGHRRRHGPGSGRVLVDVTVGAAQSRGDRRHRPPRGDRTRLRPCAGSGERRAAGRHPECRARRRQRDPGGGEDDRHAGRDLGADHHRASPLLRGPGRPATARSGVQHRHPVPGVHQPVARGRARPAADGLRRCRGLRGHRRGAGARLVPHRTHPRTPRTAAAPTASL